MSDAIQRLLEGLREHDAADAARAERWAKEDAQIAARREVETAAAVRGRQDAMDMLRSLGWEPPEEAPPTV